ncbi:hypothetical protein N0V88_000800 [Collariella sp. IMI 366227]|nr:hypothetical protein N0V88_000800 [Collariella sp. IMI 366227]
MEWFRFIREIIWRNTGFDCLRRIIPYIETYEPWFEPQIIPLLEDVESSKVEAASTTAAEEDKKPLSPVTYPESKYYSAADYRKLYLSGELTPTNVAEALLPLIRRDIPNPTEHSKAWFDTRVDKVRTAARESTQRYREGRSLGALDGVPAAVKDEYDMAGYSTCLGSRNIYVSPTDKHGTTWCVQKLEAAGALLLGKLSMHEFGLDTTGNNPIYGTPRNPHNPHYYTGGSSSGTGYAVAAGLIPIGLGSDGGGSIRIPAALCGVFGLKPTHGRLSFRPGQIAHALTVLTDAATLLPETSNLTPANRILLALGRVTPSTDYMLAQKLRRLLMQHLAWLWQEHPGMTSTRPRDVGASFASRRGHGSQLSISDPSHHVTEAIGTMYGDDDSSGAEDARPLSFIAGRYGAEHLDKLHNPDDPAADRLRLVRTVSDQSSAAAPEPNNINGGLGLRKAQTFPANLSVESNGSADRPRSPLPLLSPSLRDVQASGSQFPLSDIDNPNDIAQELSNLQALRRMSMDVGNTTLDPDLLQFSGVSLMEMPSIAPTGDDDEADPSRLLWVPARVHPELEPTAFKNFLEKRVQSMKRRSGDSLLSVDGLQRNDSMGSLRRKKSMLSRQVNTHGEGGDGYVDGADRLARRGSLHEHPVPELSLSDLVSDPTKAVQKFAQDSRQEGSGDNPILPMAPGMGLRRSKKTTYRKNGSQRYGDRATFSKRVAAKQSEDNADEPPPVPPIDPSIKPLTRVQSEPVTVTENYSRPTRTVRRQQNFSRDGAAATPSPATALEETVQKENLTPDPASSQALPVRSSSTSAIRPPPPPVPQIIETPPAEESSPPVQPPPQRPSLQTTAPQSYPDQPPIVEPPARSSKRHAAGKVSKLPTPTARAASVKEQTPASDNALAEISHPHALPGSGGSTTSNLTFIPTFEKRNKDKDDNESVTSHKSTSSWKWFKSEDKEKKKREKEKEKEREREREELSRKAKSKTPEKGHDHARMDVLQNSIDKDAPKGRESLRLDRDSIEILPQDDKKKDTNRKSSEGKKEREGFFGGLFGGSKKKSDKDSSHKKKEHRPLTPEPPPRLLRPDVDYPWTRFPIIEERAIYRMAHIKLANPRRPLHSQVLLSNFMYSYLAKVQAMHPQLQIPVSPQQKRMEEERKRREAEEAQLQMEQQMAQQAAQDGGFDFEYHRSGNQYGDSPVQQQDGSSHYVDDAQIYEYEHGDGQHHQNGGDGYDQSDQGHGHARRGSGGGQQQQHYYHQQDSKRFGDDEESSDMW